MKKNNVILALERILGIEFINGFKSSRLLAFGYVPRENHLYVVYKSYKIYRYYSVTQEVYDNLLEVIRNKESVGKAIGKYVIEPGFTYVEVELTK